jgi:hypothetical protein
MRPEPPARSATHLFAVRIWLEPLSEGQAEWRGKVEHVLTGEQHYFRDWLTLITYLRAMLPADRSAG